MQYFDVSRRSPSSQEFVKNIEKWSDQNVYACYQCGKCSAACPMVDQMDIMPNQVMKLLQLGDEETLVSAQTPWVCASCFSCSARCPRGVRIAEVMEALRIYHLRKREDHWDITKQREQLKDLPPIAVIANFRKMTG